MATKRTPTPVPNSYKLRILLGIYAKAKRSPIYWPTIDRAAPVD